MVLRPCPPGPPHPAAPHPAFPRAAFNEAAASLARSLTAAGLANIIDSTATSIGRRYARTDEIGVPYGCTVDGQTLEDGTATLRERDSMAQARGAGERGGQVWGRLGTCPRDAGAPALPPTRPPHTPAHPPPPPPHTTLPPAQIRVPVAELPALVRSLVDGQSTWEAARGQYPAQEAAADEA